MCETNRTPPKTTNDTFAEQLALLATMPARLADFAAAIPAAKWLTRPSNGAFSLLEHACHLRDIEIEAFRARLERMLADLAPALPDVDGAALAHARDYHRQDLARAQASFAAVRADMVYRLASLAPTERKRTGVLEGVGVITIDELVTKMLEHDAEHLSEIELLESALA